SPVITAFSPRDEIRTLAWPGVWPGVDSSQTSPVKRCAGSTSSACFASITGRTESSIGFLKSGLPSNLDQYSHSGLVIRYLAFGKVGIHLPFSRIVFQPTWTRW